MHGAAVTVTELESKIKYRFFDYQLDALDLAMAQDGPQQRLCLYYKTGAGKTLTALAALSVWGVQAVLVIAPPTTHAGWRELGQLFDIDVETMSHAKFRMKDTLVSKTKAIVADEMHLFGGHSGAGWKKLDRVALHLQAPLVMASATPNYNDADRVYCIQRILDPRTTNGGFLQFLYANCTTEQNPFGQMPKVTGFLHYPDAAEYLAALPKVAYLPDDLVYRINDMQLVAPPTPELDTYGLNNRAEKIVASQMEERHARVNLALIGDDKMIRVGPAQILKGVVDNARTPTLVFAVHSTVAEAAGRTYHYYGYAVETVTGGDTQKQKERKIQAFLDGELQVLVGTATLATGTDGMDKVCDSLLILDDTDDDALRRQLIGRIMPRGLGSDASLKQVHRLVMT